VNPLGLLFIVLGVLFMIIGIKGSYANFMAAVKEL
jgi:hypothetical protein